MKIKISKNKKGISFFLLFFVMLFLFTRDSYFSLAQIVSSMGDQVNQKTEKTIEVRMHKKDSAYTIQSLGIATLDYPYLSSYETFKGKMHSGTVVSFQGKPLGYFSASEMIITECWDSIGNDGKMTGGCNEQSEGDILLRIPWFPNGKYADVYNPQGQKILTIDLSSKATCNENGKCDRPVEDSINCSSDCKDNQPIVDAPKVQPAQPQIILKQTPWEKAKPFLIVGVALLALIGCIVYVIKFIRKRE